MLIDLLSSPSFFAVIAILSIVNDGHILDGSSAKLFFQYALDRTGVECAWNARYKCLARIPIVAADAAVSIMRRSAILFGVVGHDETRKMSGLNLV